MLRLILAAAAVCLFIWIGLVIFVTIKEKTVPEADPSATQAIVVLGAQVRQDGSLSVQLQWRLDKALALYAEAPQPIVVCGAQGTNEPVTEAAAMRDYLIARGVPQSDIIMEDASFNTRQNLNNAKKLLGDEKRRVLIVTSDYHLPRALALAKDLGLEACGVGSPIKLIYWPKNHFREALAWVKYWLQKAGVLSV
ncbi:MAG: YdcF family protein [Clostridia bacterium]|nr:YdcF family protein [Clostridia bacterium]